jgi:predicted hydrocarbon binding protein
LYYILKDFGGVVGVGDLAFRLMPYRRKMRTALGALAETFDKTSDQVVRLEQEQDRFLYHVDRCPVCWGRSAGEPICHITLGLLQEAMYWATSGKNIRVEEVACIAAGDAACTFAVDKRPMD